MKTCSFSWQRQCFCLLLVINVFLLLRHGKKTTKSGHQNGSRWERQSTCNTLDHDFQSHHCAKNPVTIKHWILMFMHKTGRLSLFSQKISPPCDCLSLASPSYSGTAQINSFVDVTWKCEGFRRICSIWLHRNFFASRKTFINANHTAIKGS